jgi:hypothetical protein
LDFTDGCIEMGAPTEGGGVRPHVFDEEERQRHNAGKRMQAAQEERGSTHSATMPEGAGRGYRRRGGRA